MMTAENCVRLVRAIAVTGGLLCSATMASAATFFADDFSSAPKGAVSGDFRVDRGVLVTSNPYPNRDSALYVPRFEGLGVTTAYLTFAIKYSTEACCDHLRVFVNGTNVYEVAGLGPNEDQPVIDISGLIQAMNQLEFDFTSDGSVTGSGVQLDNIMVSNQRTPASPLRFDDGSAVPEPASWALMTGGLGLAGAALRRRRTVRVTYA